MALSPQQCLLLSQCVALLEGVLVIPAEALKCFLMMVVRSTPSIQPRKAECFLAGDLASSFARGREDLFEAEIVPAALQALGVEFPSSDWQQLKSYILEALGRGLGQPNNQQRMFILKRNH